MSDEIDRAQAYDQFFRELALAERKPQLAGPSALVCEDCDEEIPEARRLAMPGCRRCVDCQTLHEHWRAL